MPIYQYCCPKCNLKFELKQSFSDESTIMCPKCQKEARRLFQPVPIIFKGSGFYATDYRSEKYKSDAKKDKDVDKPSSSSTDKKDKDADKPSSSNTDKKDKDIDKPPSSNTDKKD